MNARAIRKIMMKCRGGTFFGPRSFVNIKVPKDFFGPPPPPIPKEWGESESFSGFYRNGNVHIETGEITGPDPRVADTVWSKPGAAHFITNLDNGLFRFWYGERFVENEKGEYESQGFLTEEEVLPAKLNSEFLDKAQYDDKVIDLQSWSFKALYINIEDDHIMLVASVKWFYPERKLRACRDIQRFLKKHPQAKIMRR